MAFSSTKFLKNPRIAVLLLLVAMVVGAVYFFREVLLPFALALLLAYLLAPVIAWIHTRPVWKVKVPRGAAILGVYVIMLGMSLLSGYYIFPRFYSEVNKMVKTLPGVLKDLEQDFIIPLEESVNSWFAQFIPPPPAGSEAKSNGSSPAAVSEADSAQRTPEEKTAEINGEKTEEKNGRSSPSSTISPWRSLVEDYTYVIRRVDESSFEVIPKKRTSSQGTEARKAFRFNRQLSGAFDQFSEGVKDNIVEFVKVGQKFVRVVLQSFFTLFLVLMISGFILVDPARIHGFLRSLIPSGYQRAFDDWLSGLDHGLSGVVRGQVMICLINGVLTGIGIALLGVPFVITLSIIAAVFSLIPIFGVLISSVPILLMALTVDFTTAMLSLGWILVIHFIEANFLNPKVLGGAAKIHPVLIVFALLVGEHFAGVMGALLAVPFFSLIQNSFLFLKNRAENLDSAS